MWRERIRGQPSRLTFGGRRNVLPCSHPSSPSSTFTRSDPNLPCRLSNYYAFAKPNDARALKLMNAAATHALQSIPEIVVAYGVSDEFSFVFHKSTQLFERRSAKIVSTVVSTFTAAYVALWPEEMGGEEGRKALSLSMLPSFDGRAVCYPAWENLRDYLSWRQVDCTSPSSPLSFVLVGHDTTRRSH